MAGIDRMNGASEAYWHQRSIQHRTCNINFHASGKQDCYLFYIKINKRDHHNYATRGSLTNIIHFRF